ncbi:DUF7257 domain-containing protein [Mycobacterium aquaticum]|uniref:Minor tail protein n=1 Tax=Mycobacterium aquaticum TaxID=1927124 RepID=A0A1X0B724_9MYCO|nr:hypothetical protein [Mycobacterium aquaticum]ORA38120.1 hypothetical protein BST13_05855 [Mycobacterium aquaticum]
MSGVATLQRPPRTDQEWARQISRRLDVLENPRSLRVSDWVINSVDGKLIATRPGQSVDLDNPAGPVSVDLGSLRGFTSTDREEVINEAKTSAWQELYEKLTGQLNPVDALKSLSDFFRIELGGPISADRIPLIPLTHIRDINRNLILDGGFDTGDTLLGLPDWTHDATDGRSKPGCAVTTADGTSHVIYSNDIQVAKDDKLNLSVAVKWVGLTALAGSDAIRLNVVAYDASGVMIGGAPTMVASVASPSGNSGGTNGWGTTLSGTYTVPATAVIVTVELTVMATATAGTVKFDDAESRKTGSFLQDYVKDLPADLQSLLGWIEATVNAGLGALGIPAMGSLADKLLDFQDGLSDLQNAAEDAFANAQNALDSLADKLGISDWDDWLTNQWGNLRDALANAPATVIGMLDMTRITGLPDLNTQATQLIEIIAGHAVTPITSALQQAKDWITGTGSKTQFLTFGGLFDPTKLNGQVPSNGVAGIGGATSIGDALQQAVDAVTQGAGGLGGSGFNFLDALAQLTGLRQATAGANAAVLNVQSQLAGLDPAASSEIINFSEYVNAGAPPSMFTKVFDQGSGGIVTSGGKLVWSGSAGDERYLFNGGPLQTDLFEVNVVLPTVPSHGWFGADGNNFIYLIGRSDAAGNNMCIAEIGWDRVRIMSYNTGTTTVLATVNQSDIVTGGCRVAFKGGNALQPRYFHVAVNDDIVTSATDIAPITQLGSSFRLCGLGLKKDSSYDTGTISAWSMLDGGASAGSGVVAGMTAAGPTNLIIWKGTAAEYAAIPTKNPNTIYAVKN